MRGERLLHLRCDNQGLRSQPRGFEPGSCFGQRRGNAARRLVERRNAGADIRPPPFRRRKLQTRLIDRCTRAAHRIIRSRLRLRRSACRDIGSEFSPISVRNDNAVRDVSASF